MLTFVYKSSPLKIDKHRKAYRLGQLYILEPIDRQLLNENQPRYWKV